MACDTNMNFYREEWGNDGTSTDFTFTLKRKFRWLFKIENMTTGNIDALPCMKAARPKITFKEMQAEHLNETISYPSKPDWQPVQLTLYDRCIGQENPIMTWLKQQYDPQNCGIWKPCVDALSFKACVTLELYDGCGSMVESWLFEHAYPQNIDFGELDMSSNDVVTVDFSLRYDRAYQTYPAGEHELYTTVECSPCTDPTCTPGSISSVTPSVTPSNTPIIVPPPVIPPPIINPGTITNPGNSTIPAPTSGLNPPSASGITNPGNSSPPAGIQFKSMSMTVSEPDFIMI